MAVSIQSLFWKYVGCEFKSQPSRVERASELESDTPSLKFWLHYIPSLVSSA